MAEKPGIELADAIRSLRSELVEAVRQGKGEDVRFALGPIELELQVVASSNVGGKAGVAFWLLSFGAEGSRGSEATQTIKLTLKPVSSSGGGVVVRSKVGKRPK